MRDIIISQNRKERNKQMKKDEEFKKLWNELNEENRTLFCEALLQAAQFYLQVSDNKSNQKINNVQK